MSSPVVESLGAPERAQKVRLDLLRGIPSALRLIGSECEDGRREMLPQQSRDAPLQQLIPFAEAHVPKAPGPRIGGGFVNVRGDLGQHLLQIPHGLDRVGLALGADVEALGSFFAALVADLARTHGPVQLHDEDGDVSVGAGGEKSGDMGALIDALGGLDEDVGAGRIQRRETGKLGLA